MVADLLQLLKRFNRKTLTTILPDALDLLVGSDADFEAILSSTAKKLKIHYRGNIVTQSHAIIFVCTELAPQQATELPTLTYDNAEERAKLCHDLFANILAFDKVEICRQPTKALIIDKFAELEAEAAISEEKNTWQTVFA